MLGIRVIPALNHLSTWVQGSSTRSNREQDQKQKWTLTLFLGSLFTSTIICVAH